MKRREIEQLVEATLSAHRPNDARGQLRFHPAWHDLDDEGRREAFVELTRQRQLEAASDPENLSASAREILRRIRRSATLLP